MPDPVQLHGSDNDESQPSAMTPGGAWFYKKGRREIGPLSFKELKELAQEKLILRETEVWQEGEDRRLAASVMGLIPNKTAKPKNLTPPGQIARRGTKNPYRQAQPAQTEATIQDGPPGGMYLPFINPSPFFLLPSVLAGGAALIYIAQHFATTDEAATTLYVLAALALVASVIMALVYLHRAWAILRAVHIEVPGHRPAVLMGIPGFNMIWSFFAIFIWSQRWNQQVKSHPGFAPAPRVSSAVALAFCVCFVATQSFLVGHLIFGSWPTDLLNPTHQLSLTVMATTVVLGLIFWSQICQAVNFVAKKKF